MYSDTTKTECAFNFDAIQIDEKGIESPLVSEWIKLDRLTGDISVDLSKEGYVNAQLVVNDLADRQYKAPFFAVGTCFQVLKENITPEILVQSSVKPL